MTETAGKIIKCRAAVAWEPKKPLSIETIEVAPPKANEVRIKIIATGICHSDAHALEGLTPSTMFPVILGHESAGIVESVGDGVTKFKAGDHVIPLYQAQCKKCVYCKNPKTNFCEISKTTLMRSVMLDGTTRFSCNGKTIYHFMGTSTFSEYTVVNDVNLCKINEKAPLNKVCLLGCGIPTGYGAAINTAKVEPGSVCAIWGLGAIGLAVAVGCKAAGASKIYGVDINPAKFELGKKFGITDFVNPNDHSGVPTQDVLIEMTKGGCDFTFECIGNVNTMKSAFEASHASWGVTTIIGLAPPGQEISIKPLQLLFGRKVQGTCFGGYKSVDSVPSLVDSYMNKKLMLDEFITHTMSLADINKAFDYMLSGKSIRTVVEL